MKPLEVSSTCHAHSTPLTTTSACTRQHWVPAHHLRYMLHIRRVCASRRCYRRCLNSAMVLDLHQVPYPLVMLPAAASNPTPTAAAVLLANVAAVESAAEGLTFASGERGGSPEWSPVAPAPGAPPRPCLIKPATLAANRLKTDLDLALTTLPVAFAPVAATAPTLAVIEGLGG